MRRDSQIGTTLPVSGPVSRRQHDDHDIRELRVLTNLFGQSWKIEAVLGAELDRRETVVRELTEQQYHLLDDLNVYENIEIPLSYRNVKRKERQAIVADALDRFQIVGKKDLYPSQLSGGQQQLVAVARAIIAEPAMILADEPTGSLHSSQGRMIMDLLKQLNREGTTIIQVTHNQEYAEYGDRIIQLKDGWIVDE